MKSISKSEESKASKPKVPKPPTSAKESKSSKSSTNGAISQSAKDGDSIDETIESVLNQINSIDVASCENNSQVNQVTCEVGKKINPLNESKSATTTTVNSPSMGKDVKASTSGQKQTAVSEKKKIITVLYEEDIVDGFAIHSFLTYNDLKVSVLLFSFGFLSILELEPVTSVRRRLHVN